MLTIRPIAADELSAFLALQPDPERAADQAAYVDRMFAAGAMRPAWCYVAIARDHVVGRFAFWSLPKLDIPISLVLVDVAEPHVGTLSRAGIADALLQRAVEDALAGSPRSSATSWTNRNKRRSGRATRMSAPAGLTRGFDRPIDLALVVRGPAARGGKPTHVPYVRGGRGSSASRRPRGGLQRDARCAGRGRSRPPGRGRRGAGHASRTCAPSRFRRAGGSSPSTRLAR